MSLSHSHNIIVVAGPTATGKTDFAIALAHTHNGEIISADSRQVYRGLDIGTGKVRPEEMEGISHHMLDVIDIGEPFSVAEYAKRARPIVEDILHRGKTPIICGGTGQYIDALIYDTDVPGVPPNQTLREELEQKDVDTLFQELAEKDPYRADTVDRYNKVRLIRALEIVHELGYVPPVVTPKLLYPTELYLMSPDRDILRDRISKRLATRLEQGMIEEVRTLMEQGFTSDSMKKFGLEYEVIGAYLEGTLTEDEMKDTLITKSMQYAKRQQTWNKKYLPFATIIEVSA